MVKYTGRPAQQGIVLGPAFVLKNPNSQIMKKTITDTEWETGRVANAIDLAKKQLQDLHHQAVAAVGDESAAIFEVHQMMLEDEDYVTAIYDTIRSEMADAEYSVAVTGNQFAEMFAAMDDEYIKARSIDIKDVSARLVKNLRGEAEDIFHSEEPVVLIADDLTPSETVRLDKEKILALVTIHGSVNSHTAILARMMNIPAIVGVPLALEEVRDGMQVVVDGCRGEVIFEPSKELCAETRKRMQQETGKRKQLQELKGKKTVTKTGKEIKLYANIGDSADVDAVLENDGEGIGLFRSEFLYLGRNDYPTEEEQFTVYQQVLQRMGEKQVIIRTLDIGADKQAAYLNLDQEENPALGYRAIRICLRQPAIFKVQLRALFRAAVYGNLSIMYPMITAVEEIEQIYRIVDEVGAELEQEKERFRIPQQGIMIETPAAVMISDELAQMVDFFSIGTNDLTQYTLAIDRQNEKLEMFYNPHHKAILKMIQIVIDNAHKHQKWVGICGELGGDLDLTDELLGMGIDELSVSPAMILPLRKKVRASIS